MEQLHEINM